MNHIIKYIHKIIKSSSLYFTLTMVVCFIWNSVIREDHMEIKFMMGVLVYIIICLIIDILMGKIDFHGFILYHLISIITYYGVLILWGICLEWFRLSFGQILKTFFIFLLIYSIGARITYENEKRIADEINDLIRSKDNQNASG